MEHNNAPLPEVLLSQGLLGKLEPFIHTIESQLKDLEQGQALLLNNVANISQDLAMTESQLNQVTDIFAQLPHYIAKVNAIKSTMTQLHVQNKKLKRRTELIRSGRVRQAAREQELRAREQAYDRVIAAVEAPSASTNRSPTTSIKSSSGGGGGTGSGTASAAATAAGLPFPLPAKPAFPIVSKRSPNSSGTASPTPRLARESSPAASSSPHSSTSSSPQLPTVSIPGIENPVALPPSLSRAAAVNSSTTSGRPRQPDSAGLTTSLTTNSGSGGSPTLPSSTTAVSAPFNPITSRHRPTSSVSSSYSSSSFSISQVGIDRFPELSIGADGEGGSGGPIGAVEVVRKKKKQPKKKKSVSSVVSTAERTSESKVEQNE
ncbi:hypothetical protein BGW41_001564 [Actinomortierella wolfii]|nr:hypothetical protein BGW41_001564 [Actinomortierella wolfii]